MKRYTKYVNDIRFDYEEEKERLTVYLVIDDIVVSEGMLIWGYKDKTYYHISSVSTQKEHQRKGYATMIMQHLIDRAVAEGAKTINLNASKEGALVYKKLGFKFPRPDRGEMNLRIK